MRSPTLLACIITAALVAGGPRASDAQAFGPDTRYDALELLSGNMIVSGLGAAIIGHFRGRPFWKTFAHGAAGGAVMFVGKRISASRPELLGLVGRQVSAVGASISRSAVFGSGVLDTLFVPVGPVRLGWATGEARIATVRVDAEDVAWVAYGLFDDRFELDASRSLEAGALVFTTRQQIREDHRGTVGGLTGGGAVFLSEPDLSLIPGNRHHELVHVAQTDYLEIAFGAPLERWILRHFGWDDLAVFRYVDLGFGHYALQGALTRLLEAEAERFEARLR